MKAIKEGYVTVYEVADFFGISHHTIRSWIRQGKVDAIKIGRRVLVPSTEIPRLVKEGKRK
jgi:excisionase family DNA binding protein